MNSLAVLMCSYPQTALPSRIFLFSFESVSMFFINAAIPKQPRKCNGGLRSIFRYHTNPGSLQQQCDSPAWIPHAASSPAHFFHDSVVLKLLICFECNLFFSVSPCYHPRFFHFPHLRSTSASITAFIPNIVMPSTNSPTSRR